jgi:ribonuclease HI
MQSVYAPFDPHVHPIYEIYIDGATGSTHAGWAAVVVASTPDSRRLLGVTGGTVELSPSAHDWVGADSPDNIAAELTALLAAHAIILQQDTLSQFCIRPDLSLSRIIAQEITTTKAHPRLAQLCRIVSQWNKDRVHYLEVRGHTQDPWNELADAVAKYCTQPGRACGFAFSFAHLHELAIEAHDVAWDWLNYEHSAFKACLPPLTIRWCNSQNARTHNSSLH